MSLGKLRMNVLILIPALATSLATACGTIISYETARSETKDTTFFSSGIDPFLVKSVDLKRYVGDWFEIASIPRSFQSFCTNTMARYEIISNLEISVVNSCRVGFAPITIQGTARVIDAKSNSVLEVTLAKKKADYRIIALDPDYKFALVTNKDRSSLFVLSRSTQLEDSIYLALLDRAKSAGVDISKVTKTKQK